jgi:hypothetical protein
MASSTASAMSRMAIEQPAWRVEGIGVIRFQAIEILVDLDAVLETLLIEPDPPARGRGHQALTGHGLPPATTGVRYLAAGSL